MTSLSRRQALVDAAWSDTEAMLGGAADLAPRILRTLLGTVPGSPGPEAQLVDSSNVPTPEPSGQYLLLALHDLRLDEIGLTGGDQCPAVVSGLVSAVVDIENRILSRAVLAAGPPPGWSPPAAIDDLWHLGSRIGEAETYFGSPAAFDVLVPTGVWAAYQGDTDARRNALSRIIGGGSVALASALDPHEILLVRHGTGDHAATLMADLTVDWDTYGEHGIRFRVTERLGFGPSPRVGPFRIPIDG
jgi:hypothetical protein